jgi:archaellum component FlaC
MAYYAMELGSDEDFGSEDGDFEPAAESDEEMEEMEEEIKTTPSRYYPVSEDNESEHDESEHVFPAHRPAWAGLVLG